jgi:uncharacterized protein
MQRPRDFFASRLGIIVVGLVLGGLAVTLQHRGNPPNMGVCAACFTRDIAGALGLHRAAAVQYLRPEIPAFLLGSFLAALLFREFRPRTGSAPVIRFVLGMFAMLGALVFLGCPWRVLLRLAGGDWNALAGIVGLILGVGVGVMFLRGGFNLGRTRPTRAVTGLILPLIALVLVALAAWYPRVTENGPLFQSAKGPGALHAAFAVSLGVGLLIGFLAQRTRFCTIGGLRDFILMRDTHLLSGVLAFLLAAFALNLVNGQFHPGFLLPAASPTTQPTPQFASHTNQWLSLAAMVLAGLSFTLAGGCPGRQIFLAGEGDADAGVFVLGMLTGAALAHNFELVGNSPLAPYAIGVGLLVVGLVGMLAIERLPAAEVS